PSACVCNRLSRQRELQLLDLRALPSLDEAAAAAGLARHAIFHRRLAGVDEPVAPPADRLSRISPETLPESFAHHGIPFELVF
ncbi:MAG: hypothetical protein ACRDV2_04400, partial [Actinomycetes bacterium]